MHRDQRRPAHVELSERSGTKAMAAATNANAAAAPRGWTSIAAALSTAHRLARRAKHAAPGPSLPLGHRLEVYATRPRGRKERAARFAAILGESPVAQRTKVYAFRWTTDNTLWKMLRDTYVDTPQICDDVFLVVPPTAAEQAVVATLQYRYPVHMGGDTSLGDPFPLLGYRKTEVQKRAPDALVVATRCALVGPVKVRPRHRCAEGCHCRSRCLAGR